MKQKDFAYTGCENLEVMSSAVKYNNFLISQVVRAHGKINKPHPRVLDFGAGSGTYTTLLREMKIEADCLEPDKKLIKSLEKKGFQVYPDVTSVKKKYDLIFSLNVLEHIQDDQISLKEQYNLLNTGGLMLAYVPAFQILFSSMDRKVEHFRRYRKAELVAKAKEAGFEVLEAKYCDPIGFGAALAYKISGNQTGDLNPKAIRMFDTYFFPVSRSLEKATQKLFGKNVLLIGRKGKTN